MTTTQTLAEGDAAAGNRSRPGGTLWLTGLPSAGKTLVQQGITGLAGGFLVLRAFSSGCAALTGVEAISNGVPAFQKPKSRNAAATIVIMGEHEIAKAMLDYLLTGEHIFSWMLEDYGALHPLAEAAQILAEHEWPELYDPVRLAENDVPAAAVIYAEDPYVERDFSEQTASTIRGLRPWLTNEYDHDGLRADGERVLGRLLDLVQGRA